MGGDYEEKNTARVDEFARRYDHKIRATDPDWLEFKYCVVCGGGAHRDVGTFALHRRTAAGACQRGSCGWSGTLTELQETLGLPVGVDDSAPIAVNAGPMPAPKPQPTIDCGLWQEPHEKLLGDEVLLKKLERDRGLTRETVRQYKLGVTYQDGRPAVVYPTFTRDGVCAYVKHKTRNEDGTKRIMRAPSGVRSLLFGLDHVAGIHRVIVVEGEEDAMMLTQAGLHNVVSVPDGCKVTASAAWLDELEPFREVVICFDADEPGQEGARELSRLIGAKRSAVVNYPATDAELTDAELTDASDYAKAGRLMELVRAIDETSSNANEPVKFVGSPSMLDGILTSWSRPNPMGLSTGLKSLDGMIGGLRPGEVTVLFAAPGSGKSAMSVNIALNVARAGTPSLIVSPEVSDEDLAWRLLQPIVGKFPYARKDAPGLAMSREDIIDGMAKLSELPLLTTQGSRITMEHCEKVARFAKRRHDLGLLVLDHLGWLAMCEPGDDYLGAISGIMSRVKALAVELKIPIILISHVNRAAAGQDVPSLHTLFGASAIEQLADIAIGLGRVPDAETPLYGATIARVCKLRTQRFGRLGDCTLMFRKSSETFSDLQAHSDDAPDDDGEIDADF